ncbi:alpha-ketoglutarate decarboxylase [Eudoraea sp.]|uniref:alpha-ketoglutarate decarboxylase n=1 Tax=Eudoraea sp. TaxID=1979955 RepID=UPI003C72B242
MVLKLLSRYKYFVLIVVFSIMGLSCSAQQRKPQSEFWRNVRYGGALGFGFGSNSFSIAVAPSAIYQVSEKFATGVSLNFEYSKFGDSEFTAYGGSILNFFNPIPAIQLSAVLQPLRVSTNYSSASLLVDENYWTTALFMGIGYSTRNVTFGIQYDVLHNDRSIYADPWVPFIRMYF